jgi:hypothetical protein
MKDQMINALELLRSQHEEVEDLIEQIEDSEDADEKAQLFIQLADNLAAHSMIEEKLFYPSVMVEQTHEMLVESTEEHLAVKRLLADMMELDPDDEHFSAKLKVLKENVRHHAHDEEEDKLFPKVERMFSRDELAALGNEMLAMFEMLMEREPRRNVPAETGEAAELQPVM